MLLQNCGADFNKQIGSPDLLVLFTNTVSHKMVKTALDEVDNGHTNVIRCHTSSKNALTEILEKSIKNEKNLDNICA